MNAELVVVGLGYVGLPVVIEAAGAGVRVVGCRHGRFQTRERWVHLGWWQVRAQLQKGGQGGGGDAHEDG